VTPASHLQPGRLAQLAAAALLVLAGCGPGAAPQETASTPSTSTPGPTSEPGTDGVQAILPLPSHSVAFDHFALEGVVGTGLSEADGVDDADSTTWDLTGSGVDVRLEVSSWFSQAEAEASCASAAGAAAQSLALGSPTWTSSEAVYVTQGPACVRVTVLRGLGADVEAEAAVAALLVGDEGPVPDDS